MAKERTAEIEITSAVVLGAGVLGRSGEVHDVPEKFAAELIRRGKARLAGDPGKPYGASDDAIAATAAAQSSGAPVIGEGSLADKVRDAITELPADGFLASGAPDLKAIKAALSDEDAAKVNASIRDEVFGAMVQGGFTAPQGA